MNKKKKATLERATKNQLNDSTALSVLQALINSDEPLTRQELTASCHVSDREVREAIEVLRNIAIPVCSTSSQAGYWIGSDDEYEKYVIGEDNSRMSKMRRRHQAWKKRPLDGQVTI